MGIGGLLFHSILSKAAIMMDDLDSLPLLPPKKIKNGKMAHFGLIAGFILDFAMGIWGVSLASRL